MPITETVQAGTLPRPGPIIGRGVRLLMGFFVFALLIDLLGDWDGFLAVCRGSELPNGFLLMLVLTFYFFGEVYRRGFGLESARGAQLVLLFLSVTGVAFGYLVYGDWWGPPFGVLVFLLSTYVLGHLGLSFSVAAAFATPG